MQKDVPLQPTSIDIWDKKYRLKDFSGNPIDQTIDDTMDRVARSLASVELTPELRSEWYDKFKYALDSGAIPAGRITSNAGAEKYKANTSLINCLAGETPVLTDEGIFDIHTLVGKHVRVLNGNGNWSPVEFKHYGKQHVYKSQFKYADSRKPMTIRSTKNHRWVLRNGRVITTEYWLTGKQYTSPHTLMSNIFPTPHHTDKNLYNAGLLHGAVYGDGTYLGKRLDGTHRHNLPLCGDKVGLSYIFESILGYKPTQTTFNAAGASGLRFNTIKQAINLKELPITTDKSYIEGFIAGLIATDGNVHRVKNMTSTIAVYGSQALYDWLVTYAPIVGVIPSWYTITKKGHSTNYGPRSNDMYIIHFQSGTIHEKLILRQFHKDNYGISTNGNARKHHWRCTDTHKTSELVDVYCCQEPETGSFVLGHGLLTGNCVLGKTVNDSMEGILDSVREAGLSLAVGNGIGFEMSTMRPKGAFINGAGATTSGALSFMHIFDSMCFTIASAGGRRGAMMATFDISHPDVTEFIKIKSTDGVLRQFNLSLLITQNFMDAVDSDSDWHLSFPMTKNEIEVRGIDINDPKMVIWREWPEDNGYVYDTNGRVACRIYETLKARTLWNTIMESTYNMAEPGILLIDEINRTNNLWFNENIRATNPCAEIFLPPNGSCLLGSINLTKFISKPFTPEASFDYEKYIDIIHIFSRMLDNVVEKAGLPLPAQREEIIRKRRHGMGYLGLGSAMVMLGIKYGSQESLNLTDEVSKLLTIEGYRAGLDLAKEKGAAPIMDEYFDKTEAMVIKCPSIKDLPDRISGRVLFAHSKMLQRVAKEAPELVEQLAVHGCRYSHCSAIAPTGTISLSLGNNASNGIEPSFSHMYSRNVIREGKNTKEKVDVCSFELLAYREYINKNASPEATNGEDKLPAIFCSAESIPPKEHVDVQAAAQYWIDQAISKTINVPTDYPFEDFKDIYTYAASKGLKGCTTFRFNPENFQGVLVNDSDLENTKYEFTLKSGETLIVAGNEMIEYDGEQHTAANLYDALKEGYYGKL